MGGMTSCSASLMIIEAQINHFFRRALELSGSRD